jgi:hypothetical protein
LFLAPLDKQGPEARRKAGKVLFSWSKVVLAVSCQQTAEDECDGRAADICGTATRTQNQKFVPLPPLDLLVVYGSPSRGAHPTGELPGTNGKSVIRVSWPLVHRKVVPLVFADPLVVWQVFPNGYRDLTVNESAVFRVRRPLVGRPSTTVPAALY